MFCPKCGESQSDAINFCNKCGANIAFLQDAASPKLPATESMSFGKALSVCLSKYFDFSGRASRPEYWWFYLFGMLLGWGFDLSLNASLSMHPELLESMGSLHFIPLLVLFFPGLTAGVRRLHDTNRSGWRFLWLFTIFGGIPIVIWLASKGTGQDNKYGRPV